MAAQPLPSPLPFTKFVSKLTSIALLFKEDMVKYYQLSIFSAH